MLPLFARNAQTVHKNSCYHRTAFMPAVCSVSTASRMGPSSGNSQAELRSWMNWDGSEEQDEHPAAWSREPVEMHIQLPQGMSESCREAASFRMEQGPVLLQGSSISERMAQTTAHITHCCGSSSGHTLSLLLILRS